MPAGADKGFMHPSLCRRPPSQTLSAQVRNPLFASFIRHTNYDPRVRSVHRIAGRLSRRKLKRWCWVLALLGGSSWLVVESAFGLTVF